MRDKNTREEYKQAALAYAQAYAAMRDALICLDNDQVQKASTHWNQAIDFVATVPKSITDALKSAADKGKE